jgi:hypothetical protein
MRDMFFDVTVFEVKLSLLHKRISRKISAISDLANQFLDLPPHQVICRQ